MAIPPQFKDLIEVDVNTLTYAPHIWFNDFWLLRDYLVGGWVGGWVVAGVGMRASSGREASLGGGGFGLLPAPETARNLLPLFTGPCPLPPAPCPAPLLQVPVNSTVTELPLHFELGTSPAWKHLLMSQVGGARWGALRGRRGLGQG